MRTVEYSNVVDSVRELCIRASRDLPIDIYASIKAAAQRETIPTAKRILEQLVLNADLATSKSLPICQDTGSALFFVQMGTDVRLSKNTILDAINDGTRIGYTEGFLRPSIVNDPLFDRKNSSDNTPAIINVDIIPGDTLKITILPKGGGCENMSALRMLTPSAGIGGIKDFVVETVTKAGGNPCPPVILGIGIGGTADKAMMLAKKAHLRSMGERHEDPRYAALEKELYDLVNKTGVGPQGLGGATTALDVRIETFPCHIASMPVALNFNCHAARMADVDL
jgi:fumarate hydratase subunit alpha